MDAFASVISNNLNIVMKVLTVITIVMSVPTMVFSFYGMNVLDLPLPVYLVPGSDFRNSCRHCCNTDNKK